MTRDAIRVLHLIKGLGRGGAEMLLLETRRAAEDARLVHAYGYLLPHKSALVEPLQQAGSEVTCFPMASSGSFPLCILRLARFVRRRRIDLIHAHLPVAGIAARLAGRWTTTPVVYTEHNLHERYHPVTRRLNLWTWTLQRRVLAVSQQVRASILRHVGSRVPVEVLWNGIPVERYRRLEEERARCRARLGVPDDAPLIGTTAVFRPQKRLDDWLRAAAEIRSHHPAARFLLVGDGPLRAKLELTAQALELGGSLHWAGLQSDVRPWLAAMDLYLQSSDYEGLPVALLEAMAMELPVVASTVGGVPEAVLAGETGLLVPPRQPEALAAAARSLLDQPEARDRLGRQGRRRVCQCFDVQRMQERLEAIYRETCRGSCRESSRESSRGIPPEGRRG